MNGVYDSRLDQIHRLFVLAGHYIIRVLLNPIPIPLPIMPPVATETWPSTLLSQKKPVIRTENFLPLLTLCKYVVNCMHVHGLTESIYKDLDSLLV